MEDSQLLPGKQCCTSSAMQCQAMLHHGTVPGKAHAEGLTSPQVAEKAAPTLYSTKLRQAAARATQLSPAILFTARKSHSYNRQSVCASTFLQKPQQVNTSA